MKKEQLTTQKSSKDSNEESAKDLELLKNLGVSQKSEDSKLSKFFEKFKR